MLNFAAAANVDPFFAVHGEDITVNGATIEALADLGYSMDERNPHRPRRDVDRSFTVRTSDRDQANIAKGNILVYDAVQYQVLNTPVDDGMGLTSFQVIKATTGRAT